jgi:hypothetical protein
MVYFKIKETISLSEEDFFLIFGHKNQLAGKGYSSYKLIKIFFNFVYFQNCSNICNLKIYRCLVQYTCGCQNHRREPYTGRSKEWSNYCSSTKYIQRAYYCNKAIRDKE